MILMSCMLDTRRHAGGVLFPSDYTSYSELAALHRRLGRHDVARENLEQALLIEPDRPGIVRELAEIDLQVGRFADARAGFAP